MFFICNFYSIMVPWMHDLHPILRHAIFLFYLEFWFFPDKKCTFLVCPLVQICTFGAFLGINSANISIFHFLKWHLIVQYLQFLASIIQTKFTQNTLNSAYNDNKPNPWVSVCWHSSRCAWNTHIITHADLFTQWGRKRDVELFTQWGRKRVGRVGDGVSCSSHQPNWLQLSSETKLTSITVCQHSLS